MLGETYSLDDQEDSAVKTITRLWLHQSRYRVEVTEVPAGCWALIEGIDSVPRPPLPLTPTANP